MVATQSEEEARARHQGVPLFAKLVQVVVDKSTRPANRAVVTVWDTENDLHRFVLSIGQDGAIETNLPTTPAEATVKPVVITLLIPSENGLTLWAVVFERAERTWFKLSPDRYFGDLGLTMAQEVLDIYNDLKLAPGTSSKKVVSETTVPFQIEDWILDAYRDYLKQAFAS